VKPLLRLTWPILGARNEWNAILEFHEANLATMTPVAIGESGSNSFLITEAIENCTKLSELKANREAGQPLSDEQRSRIIRDIAKIARAMHAAGLHHQDFYLGHLLFSPSENGKIYVIDLGRVLKRTKLARRWIVKDLAQLDYSASASAQDRLRFLREYLGRRLNANDRRLIDSIQQKNASIARHSRKNRL
jgi:heptose I phosphotransferase